MEEDHGNPEEGGELYLQISGRKTNFIIVISILNIMKFKVCIVFFLKIM